MNWLLTAVCLAMAAIIYRTASRTGTASSTRSPVFLGLGLALPPLLLVLCLATTAGRMDQLRVSLEEVFVDNRALVEGLTIGGGEVNREAADLRRLSANRGNPILAADDLIVGGLPPGMVTAVRMDDRVTIAAHPMAQGEGAGAVSVGKRGKLRIQGAYRFEPGDAVCLERCSAGGSWLTLHKDGARLVDQGGNALATFPERKMWRWIEGVAFWNAGQRIYPLRDFGRPTNGARLTDSAADDPCLTRFLCVGVGKARKPAFSFLYRQGGLFWGGDRMWIMLLDPDARVRTSAGAILEPVERKVLATHDLNTESAKPTSAKVDDLSFWSVRYADADDPADASAPPSRLVERRAVDLQLDDSGLRVRLETPKVLVANVVGEAPSRTYTISGRSEEPAASGDATTQLNFDMLGGRTASRAGGGIVLESKHTAVAASSEGGLVEAAYGQPFRLGPNSKSSGGARQGGFRVERLGVPWIIVLIALLTAAVLFAALATAWRDRPVAWLLMIGMQLLLAIRWLIGLEGAFLDESLDWRALMIANGVAYVTLPSLFGALTLWRTGARREAGALAIFTTAAVIALTLAFGLTAPWKEIGRFDAALAGLSIGLAGAAAVGPETLRRFATMIGQGLDRWPWIRAVLFAPAAVTLRGVGAVKRFASAMPKGARDVVTVLGAIGRRIPDWGWVLGLGLVFRLGVGLFGVKERFTFPETLAVSVIYLPWMLVGFALLFRVAHTEGRGRWWPAAGMVTAMVLAMIVAPFLMNDSGFAILLIAPAFWALSFARCKPKAAPPPAATTVRRSPKIVEPEEPKASPPRWVLAQKALWAGPVAAITLLLGGALLFPLVNQIGVSEQTYEAAAVADNDDSALALVRKNMVSDQILLRFFTIASPGILSSTGTSEAEKLRRWSAYLNDYTADALGRGYLQPSRFGPLSDVHMTDNVSAVHIMSPFGRLGAAALLLVLGVLAFACQRLSPPVASAPDWRRIAGLLALWTVFAAAAYMVLANLQIVPFTGRNVYFLAAKSNSDLVEGAILFLMAFWGLARRHPV